MEITSVGGKWGRRTKRDKVELRSWLERRFFPSVRRDGDGEREREQNAPGSTPQTWSKVQMSCQHTCGEALMMAYLS